MPQTDKMDFDSWKAARQGMIPLTLALCFTLGWQGGTVHQVAAALKVSTQDILNADDTCAGDLLRKAQAVKREEAERDEAVNITAGTDINTLLFKHLKVCVENLKLDYVGHDIPPWLERAAGVVKITSESIAA